MNKLNVIPYPKLVEYLGGEALLHGVNCSAVQAQINPALGKEEYTLRVDGQGIVLEAGSQAGAFYGRQTLRMLGERTPCVFIKDAPEFSHRAFMLDTVRHIISIEDTKRFIDAAASVKMNAMHWHLTDDQGWRIELDGHPEITRKASVRHGSHFGNGGHDDKDYGGYFTKAQLREIVDYCAERFITVIPEFDMPGHNVALLHACPELSCTGKPIEVETRQGIFPDTLCMGKDKTLETVFSILDEILEIFPGRLIHIGGDEAPPIRWLNCPDCKKRMSDNSLATADELQGWFTNKVADYLRSKGRQAVVWNESLRSGKVKDVIVQNWMDKSGLCPKYANEGGKVIMSDFFHLYCDYPYSMTPLKKTYSTPLFAKTLTEQGKKNILGVEATVWLEYIDTPEKLFYQCFPRFTAAAEIGWSSSENLDEKDFERRFKLYREYLVSLGISPADAGEWNPSLFARAGKTLKFFKNTFNPKAVKGYE